MSQEGPRELKVGVLGIQGDVSEHVESVNRALALLGKAGGAVTVKRPEQLEGVCGLIIPGGESTTIGNVSHARGLTRHIVDYAQRGMTVLGTCAGAIMLAREVADTWVGRTSQPLLGLMNIKVVRNAFGRQRESFEAPLLIPALGEKPFRSVFIRAPVIERVWGNAKILATYEGKAVLAQEGNVIASAFHPELSGDLRLHCYFLQAALKSPLLT